MTHKVISPLVVARQEDGSDIYLYEGVPVPDSVGKDEIARLIDGGFIEASGAKPAQSESETEAPSKSWNHDRLDAWAAEQDPPIVFTSNADGKDLTKEQKLEQIAAAVSERSAQQ